MLLFLLLSINLYSQIGIGIVPKETVTDIEGNVYTVARIGTQRWMGENLRTSKLNNGTDIPFADLGTLGPDGWRFLTTPAYTYYRLTVGGITSYITEPIHGKLYNSYVFRTGILCPTGWHVPTTAEFETLDDYLGGDGFTGTKLKANFLWNSGAGNDSYGFTAVASGLITGQGSYQSFGDIMVMYTSTPSEFSVSSQAVSLSSFNNNLFFEAGTGEKSGYSIRCIKD